MNKMMNIVFAVSLAAFFAGCATATKRIVAGESTETVAGFSEEDINDTVSRAIQSICSLDRIKTVSGAGRAVIVVEDVVNDTKCRGRDAAALSQNLGQSLREELTNSGKVLVYNREVGQYAKVKVKPQYVLNGRLLRSDLRQDNGDRQIEYNLNLTLVEVDTGYEFWQKRIHVGKVASRENAL